MDNIDAHVTPSQHQTLPPHLPPTNRVTYLVSCAEHDRQRSTYIHRIPTVPCHPAIPYSLWMWVRRTGVGHHVPVRAVAVAAADGRHRGRAVLLRLVQLRLLGQRSASPNDLPAHRPGITPVVSADAFNALEHLAGRAVNAGFKKEGLLVQVSCTFARSQRTPVASAAPGGANRPPR